MGRLDAVINNAGISDPALFEALSVDHFRRMLDVHFFGTLFVIKAAWPHMVRSGYGRIVNTVSEAMLGGLAELTSYGAAKGAVFGLTRNLATEGVAHGIRVNALRLGHIHGCRLSSRARWPHRCRFRLS